MKETAAGRPRVGWLDCPEFDLHVCSHAHPERPDRLRAIRAGLARSGLAERLERIRPREISDQWLLRVHDAAYVESLHRLVAAGGGQLDPDTYVVAESEVAARLAAGAVQLAVEKVLSGQWDRAFCSVRPPGHHARATTGMGFCLFNNVAVGAEVALGSGVLSRVGIFDWDVHHGNGTEEIFYHRGDVFYASVHQRPAYPGTGDPADRGALEGARANLNVPLSPGSSDNEFLEAWDLQIEPALRNFEPEILLVSAGFDAAGRDPLAQLEVTTHGFAEMSRRVVAFANEVCKGRLIAVLEGGYDTSALSDDVPAFVEALLT